MSDKHFDSLLGNSRITGNDSLNTSCVSHVSNMSYVVGTIDKDDFLEDSLFFNSTYLPMEEIQERDREETMKIDIKDLPRLSINNEEIPLNLIENTNDALIKINSGMTFGKSTSTETGNIESPRKPEILHNISEESLEMISNLKSENSDLKASIILNGNIGQKISTENDILKSELEQLKKDFETVKQKLMIQELENKKVLPLDVKASIFDYEKSSEEQKLDITNELAEFQ